MKFTPQSIPDILLIEPLKISDNRGYFLETFREDLFDKVVGKKISFVQENQSKSLKGVLRGLHYQLPPFAQSKLIRVVDGTIIDVAVDIRESSPSFGKYVSAELSSINNKQLFIPIGFAHGFIVLSETATVAYKVDNYHSSKDERSIYYNDPKIDIEWKIPSSEIILSDKDKSSPFLDDAIDIFD